MLRSAVLVAFVCSCDYVWNLEHFEHTGDGSTGDGSGTTDALRITGCPMFPIGGSDMDGDGVGDLCDPDPNNPAQPDCFVLYDSFPDPSPASPWLGWSDDGAKWDQCGDRGAYLCSPRTSSIAALYYARALVDVELVALDLDLQNHTVTAGTALEVGATVMPGAGGDVTGRVCGLVPVATTDYVQVTDRFDGTDTNVSPVPTTIPYQNSRSYRLTWRPPQHSCTVDSATYPTATADAALADPHVGTFVAIRAAHSDLNIHWIAAFSKTCP